MTRPIIPSDGELLRLMMAGDDHAFTMVYRRHQGPVYRFALLMSGSATIAEDATQETFLVLIRGTDRYDPERGPLGSYLFGITRNVVLRRLERERSYVPLVEESEDGEEILLTQLVTEDNPFIDCARMESISLVRHAVLALPPRYREVVVLCDFEEMSYVEAALVLGCPVGTVSSRLYRGHIMLLERLRAMAKLDSASPDAQYLRCFA